MAILVDVTKRGLMERSTENQKHTCTYAQAMSFKKMGARQGKSIFQWYPAGPKDARDTYCLTSDFIGDHLRTLSKWDAMQRADAFTLQEMYNIIPADFMNIMSRLISDRALRLVYASGNHFENATVAFAEAVIEIVDNEKIKFRPL